MPDDFSEELKLLGFDAAPPPPPPDPAEFAEELELLGFGPPTTRPPSGSELEQRERMLRKREADPPVDMGQVAKDLQQITANSLEQSDNRTALDYLRKFQEAGFDGALDNATHEAVDDAVAAANRNYVKLLTGAGLDRVGGAQADKLQLRKGALASELLARQPMEENELRKLVKSTVNRMTDQRIAEVYDQVRGSGGKGQPEAEQLAAYAQQLKGLDEGALFQLYKYALYDSHKAPVNSQEAELLKEAEAPFPFMPLAREALRLHEEPQHPTLAGGWVPGLRDPAAQFYQKMTPENVRYIFRNLFGAESSVLLRDEVVRGKTAFARARVGLVAPSPDQIVPGYTADGMNFLTFVPSGPMERLVAAKAAQDAKGGPSVAEATEIEKSLLELRQDAGPEAVRDAYGKLVQQRVGDLTRHLADVASQPELPEPALTPTQKAELAPGLSLKGMAGVAAGLLTDMETIFKGAAQAVRDMDEVVSRSRFVRDTWAQGMVSEYAGDQDQAARTQTLTQALAFTTRSWLQTMQGLSGGAMKERLRELGLPNSPEARELLLSMDQNRGEATKEYYKNWYTMQDDRRKYLGDFLAGDVPLSASSIGAALGSAVELTAGMAYVGNAEMLAMLVDDPAEVAGMLAGGKALHATTKPLVDGITGTGRQLAYHWRIKNDLQSLLRSQPEEAGRFLEAARTRLAESTNPTQTLSNAVAVLEGYADRRNIDGVGKASRETARIMARAWPELKDGLGHFGHFVGTKLIPRNVAGQIGRAVGLIKQPNKMLTALLGTEKTSDAALRALQDMTTAKGDMLLFYTRHKQFSEQNGRAPTPAEVKQMLPDSMVDLHGLMQAAERHNLSDPKIKAMFHRAYGDNVPDLPGLVGTAEEAMNQYVEGAIGLVGATRKWGLARDRGALFIDTAFRRLDNHAQVLELEIDTLRRLQQANPSPELARQLASAEAEHFQTRHEAGVIQKAKDNIYQHNPSQPWYWPREIHNILFRRRGAGSTFEHGVITGETMDMLLRLHPALFDGVLPESLWKTARRPLPKSQLEALDKTGAGLKAEMDEARAALTKARTEKVTGDRQLKKWRASQRGHGLQITKLMKEGAKAHDPVLIEQRARYSTLEQSIKERSQKIEQDLVTPEHVTEARARLDAAIAARKDHIKLRARNVSAGVIDDRVLDVRQYARVLRMATHEGLTDAQRMGFNSMLDARAASGVMRALGLRGNPYNPRWLPPEQKVKLVHDAIHNTGWHMQARLQRAEDYAEALQGMSQVERDLLGAAQREGRRPSELYKKYPKLEQLYKDEDGLNTVLSNLDTYWEQERASFDEMIDLIESSGRTPEHVIADLRRPDLNPRMYYAGRVEQFATRKATKQALGQEPELGPHPELGGIAQDWSEFQFRREPGKWRVRVQEPQKVVSKLFDSRDQMREWLRDQYGADADRLMRMPAARGVQKGRTMYNEPVSIGSPLTKEEMVRWGEVLGATPEARLNSLRAGVKDAYLSMLAETLNHFGGMVLDNAQHLEFVGDNAGLKRRYQKVPNNVLAFGKLAGKHVHRRVLAELEQASKTFETIQGMMDAYRDAVPASSGLMSTLAKQLDAPTLRKINAWVKDNVILKSARAWIAQFPFNAISTHLAGATKVFSVEGLPRLWDKVVLERPGKEGAASPLRLLGKAGRQKTDLVWERLRDPYLQEAREQGLIGGLFEADSEAFRDMNRRIFGLDPKEKGKVARILDERRALYTKLRAEKLKAGGGESAELTRLSNEINVREDALREANRGWVSTSFRKLMHVGLNGFTRDFVGQPTSKWWQGVRRWYNHLDESVRLMTYTELRERGAPATLAASRTRLFFQDYANLPSWVRRLSKSPFGSLVVSFPHELGRIAGNALMYEPAKFVSTLAMMPALNMMQFAQAGIGWDRARAMLEARGKKGDVSQALSMLTSLYFTDPTTRSITGSIDFGNALPYAGLLQGKGFLAQMYDRNFPVEQRGFMGQAVGLGVNAVSNFVLSNPIFNGMLYAGTGTDPLTGERLVDENMPAGKRMRTILKLIAADVLPPQLYGGRDWQATFWRPSEAGVSPLTERLARADEPITAGVRGLTGLTVRGTPAASLASLLGINTRAKDPTLVDDDDLIIKAMYDQSQKLTGEHSDIAKHGEYNELRDLFNRSIDTSLTKEQRDAALSQAKAVSKEMHESDLKNPLGGMTDRQFRLMADKIAEDGVADRFATQPIHVQAATLALLDQWKLPDDRIRELLFHAQHTETGDFRWPRDPQIVQMAISILDERLKVPGHSPRLDDFRKQLEAMKDMSEVLDQMDALWAPLKKEQKAAVKQGFTK